SCLLGASTVRAPGAPGSFEGLLRQVLSRRVIEDDAGDGPEYPHPVFLVERLDVEASFARHFAAPKLRRSDTDSWTSCGEAHLVFLIELGLPPKVSARCNLAGSSLPGSAQP